MRAITTRLRDRPRAARFLSIASDEEAFDANGSMTRLFDRGDGAARPLAVAVAAFPHYGEPFYRAASEIARV